MTDRHAADALYAAAASLDEQPLWQALADAINGLVDYGIDPFPGRRVIDDEFVHGSSPRPAGNRLVLRSPDGRGTPACWVVEDRDAA